MGSPLVPSGLVERGDVGVPRRLRIRSRVREGAAVYVYAYGGNRESNAK